MPRPLRNTGAMLFDIYNPDVMDLDIIDSIFYEMNENASHHMPKIGKRDIAKLKYVALMYDQKSPIRKETIDRRKLLAAEQAEFGSQNEAEEAVSLKNKRVVLMVHLYLKYQGSHTWAALQAVSESFWQNNFLILSGALDAKEQDAINKLEKSNDEKMERLSRYTDELFGDNTEMMEEIVSYSVEDFVELIVKAEKELKEKEKLE
jgi:hypothetical protein